MVYSVHYIINKIHSIIIKYIVTYFSQNAFLKSASDRFCRYLRETYSKVMPPNTEMNVLKPQFLA